MARVLLPLLSATASLAESLHDTIISGVAASNSSVPSIYPAATTILSTSIPIETPWRAYGNLVSLVDQVEQHDGLFLFGSSCGSSDVPGYVPGNCSETCSSVEQAFGSPPAFVNCAAYSTITKALAGPAAAQREDLATNWGILPDDTVGADKVHATIMDCLREYARSLPACQNDTDFSLDCPAIACQEDLGLPIPLNASLSPSFNGDVSQCIYAVCMYVSEKAPIDLDIGGVGVRISFIQVERP